MSGTLVDFGIVSSHDFFREVAWPNHVAFGRQPSTITALNAAWAYWHLHEWHFWDHHPSRLSEKEEKALLQEYRNQMFSECPEMRWLRDMTEAWKHRRLRRNDVRVRSVCPHTIGGAIGTAPIATTPICASLTTVVVDVAGTTHELSAVMQTVLLYWLAKLLSHHVDFAVGPNGQRELCESRLDWCRSKLGHGRHGAWRWALLRGVAPPDYQQRFGFREKADAEAFERWCAQAQR